MEFDIYKSIGFQELTITVNNNSMFSSHMLYLNTSGIAMASTITPQDDVDYTTNNEVKIVGVDLL